MKNKRKTLYKNLKNITKKQKLQEKGITLIALVVTIIILLILAGVTLNIALSDNGLFSKAKEATDRYKQAQNEETESIRQISTQMYSEYVGANVEGYSLEENNKTVTIYGITSGLGESNKDDEGNVIANTNIKSDGSQTFTTDKGMQWKIWDFDGNTLRIIGNPTQKLLTLKGIAGYNNGIWVLNNICNELYSNGKEGVNVTNLNRTDIQNVSTYDYTKFKHSMNYWTEEVNETDPSKTIQFGEVKKFDDTIEKIICPEVWEKNDKYWAFEYNDEGTVVEKEKNGLIWEDIGSSDGKNESSKEIDISTIKFKQSSYWHNYKENEFINYEYYDMIFEEGMSYYLGTRCTHFYGSTCGFGMQMIGWYAPKGIIYHTFYNTLDEDGIQSYAVRPIVSIDINAGGFKMETVKDDNGKIITCKLSWI